MVEGKSRKEEIFKDERKSEKFKRSLEMFKSLSTESKQIRSSGKVSKGSFPN